MHISSGRWVYGFFLTLLTALLWGILPIKLKQVLQVMDPITVTWTREHHLPRDDWTLPDAIASALHAADDD
jgi:hypothetical protein